MAQTDQFNPNWRPKEAAIVLSILLVFLLVFEIITHLDYILRPVILKYGISTSGIITSEDYGKTLLQKYYGFRGGITDSSEPSLPRFIVQYNDRNGQEYESHYSVLQLDFESIHLPHTTDVYYIPYFPSLFVLKEYEPNPEDFWPYIYVAVVILLPILVFLFLSATDDNDTKTTP